MGLYESREQALEHLAQHWHEEWRRQHAVTVWNAMAAVVMVAVVHSIGDHERKEAAVKAYYDWLEDFFKYR